MENKNAQVIVPIISMILAVILAGAMYNSGVKLLFILCVGIEVVLYFKIKGNEDILWKILFFIFGGVICILLVLSVYHAGSLATYIEKVSYFFQSDQSEEKELYTYLTDISNQNVSNLQEITDVDKQISDINKYIEKLSNNIDEYKFLMDKKDPQEVEELLRIITEEYNEAADSFSELKTSKRKVELFYKMRLSRKLYQYTNMIQALEAYGINCEEYSIDEYVLMRWDVEVLFAKYAMRQSIEEDIINDVFYDEKKELYFNDFKISMNEYSDTFDYGYWNYWGSNLSAKDMAQNLDSHIMDYYVKFSINFKRNLE